MMNKTIKIFKIISIIALLFMLTVATSCKKTNNDKILDNINNVEDNMSKNNTIDKTHSIKTLPYLSSNSYFKGAKWVKEYLYCY